MAFSEIARHGPGRIILDGTMDLAVDTPGRLLEDDHEIKKVGGGRDVPAKDRT
jgi:hypothetical protein